MRGGSRRDGSRAGGAEPVKHFPTLSELLDRSDEDLDQAHEEATELLFLLTVCNPLTPEISACRDREWSAVLNLCGTIEAAREIREAIRCSA
jgi:hypothetical protein